ncbi:hypothetical protein JL107_09060 [Nakamurella flavida]|uniref:Uncharacterized protein n=1 Tax=Nakamurella flavida TaxID=363630 RepID=A0A938YPH3_9ACTN|nr:hypothetical protein [Nakamurella flavida]MBM9476590.1 hypothetical protein [Nakamurella flavida]MDP9778972.1 hypothetical protein [Nakamurella flavida]
MTSAGSNTDPSTPHEVDPDDAALPDEGVAGGGRDTIPGLQTGVGIGSGEADTFEPEENPDSVPDAG